MILPVLPELSPMQTVIGLAHRPGKNTSLFVQSCGTCERKPHCLSEPGYLGVSPRVAVVKAEVPDICVQFPSRAIQGV